MSSGFSGETPCYHLVAMPYPGRGHINPMMNLCKLLVNKCVNLNITFIITEEWLGFIGSTPKPPTITFQTIPNVIPSELIRASANPEFVRAVLTKMEAPVEHLLYRLQLSRVLAIISDTFLPWAVALGNRMNIPVVSIWTMSPSLYSVFFHFDLLIQKGYFLVDLLGNEVIDYIPGVSPTILADLPTLISGLGKQVLDHALEAFCCIRKAQCVMFTSFYELERQVIDSLNTTHPFPVYSVGPLIPHMTLDSLPDANMECMKWLDSQPAKSVLYISFGSFLSVSREQMDEIVEGVRESGVTYLWVARGDTSRIQEACGEMGLVVPWCDQLKVLCHSAVGGFWTHCGWNSTLEGVYAGVPMFTFPIIGDQIPDSKLIVDDWKVGMTVGDVTKVKLVRGKDISGIVQRFMSPDGNESKEMRRNASELKETCRRALSKGGSSEASLNNFIRDFLKCQ